MVSGDCKDLAGAGNGRVTGNGYRVSFGDNENTLKLEIITNLCEYTTELVKKSEFCGIDLYFNKAVIKRDSLNK